MSRSARFAKLTHKLDATTIWEMRCEQHCTKPQGIAFLRFGNRINCVGITARLTHQIAKASLKQRV